MYLKCCDVFKSLLQFSQVHLVWTSSVIFVCNTQKRFFFFFGFCFHRLEMCLQSLSHVITNEIVTSRFTPIWADYNSWEGKQQVPGVYIATACQLLPKNCFERVTVLGFVFFFNSRPHTMVVHDPNSGSCEAKAGDCWPGLYSKYQTSQTLSQKDN